MTRLGHRKPYPSQITRLLVTKDYFPNPVYSLRGTVLKVLSGTVNEVEIGVLRKNSLVPLKK